MINKKELDNMLEKLINHTHDYLDYSIKNDKYSKDLAENLYLVLSLAYERIGKDNE